MKQEKDKNRMKKSPEGREAQSIIAKKGKKMLGKKGRGKRGKGGRSGGSGG